MQRRLGRLARPPKLLGRCFGGRLRHLAPWVAFLWGAFSRRTFRKLVGGHQNCGWKLGDFGIHRIARARCRNLRPKVRPVRVHHEIEAVAHRHGTEPDGIGWDWGRLCRLSRLGWNDRSTRKHRARGTFAIARAVTVGRIASRTRAGRTATLCPRHRRRQENCTGKKISKLEFHGSKMCRGAARRNRIQTHPKNVVRRTRRQQRARNRVVSLRSLRGLRVKRSDENLCGWRRC